MKLSDFDETIDNIIFETKKYSSLGKVASYIPELENVDEDNFAMAIVDTKGNKLEKGDFNLKFSIQSISKIIDLIMALEDVGEEKVFSKIGTEPTEYKFNSLIPITDKVVNPLINSGAITTTSFISGCNTEEKFERVLEKVKVLSGTKKVEALWNVYNSEMKTADRNRAISYFLKSKGIIKGNVEDVLDLYTRNCSIGLNVTELAHIGSILANGGMSLDNKERLIEKDVVRITLALMSSCGMYEESGKYLVEVGFPSKSGVGGGILAIVPGKYGICTYSPRLDEVGNSVRGLEVLKAMSKKLDLNIFVS